MEVVSRPTDEDLRDWLVGLQQIVERALEKQESSPQLETAVDHVHKLEAELAEWKHKADKLAEALRFYADPLTYFGIGIFPDQPCGEFWEDISEVPWPDGGTNHKPGKLARAVLAEWDQG